MGRTTSTKQNAKSNKRELFALLGYDLFSALAPPRLHLGSHNS